MSNILDAYNIEIRRLPGFYSDLNEEFEFEPGKTSSLGIVYWGKDDFLQGLPRLCSAIARSGVKDMLGLQRELRTPANMKKYGATHGISERALRVLAHDVKMWLPQPLELTCIPLLGTNPKDIERLRSANICNQLALLSRCQKRSDRLHLSKLTGIEPKRLVEHVRICDYFRMGGKVDAIRPMLYYRMGLDTFEKWASSRPNEIIERFKGYLSENGLVGKYLVPFPKEVANGIAWAAVHNRVFAVNY